MQITIKGEMTLGETGQAIYEALGELEQVFAIAHVRGVTLYVNPSDGKGGEVVARGKDGKIVSRIVRYGAYDSAADKLSI